MNPVSKATAQMKLKTVDLQAETFIFYSGKGEKEENGCF